jgi:hypothetical protein
MLLLQSELVPWSQIALFGPTVVILAMLLWFLLRAAPTWREFKLRELEVRDHEAQARSDQAEANKLLGSAVESMGAALGGLSGALNANSQVLANVAIEQRRATESVRVLQRVNAELTERLRSTVDDLAHRLEGVEERAAGKESRPNTH